MRRKRHLPNVRWRGHKPQILVPGQPNPQVVACALRQMGKLSRQHPFATEPLTHVQLLMLYRRLEENKDRAFVQLQRLNAYFGRRWMLGVERVANNATKRWICFRTKDGKPRSKGGRFFAVVMNKIQRERERGILSLRGARYLMLAPGYQRESTPVPRMMFIPYVARRPPVLKGKAPPAPPTKPKKSPFHQAKGKRANVEVEVMTARRPAR